MRIAGWGLLAVVLLLPTGCAVDAIVRDQDNQIEMLQDENNAQRSRIADLTEVFSNTTQEEPLDVEAEIRRRFEALGLEVTSSGGAIVVTLVDSILFMPGSATLKTDSRQTLDGVAQVLVSKFTDSFIRVEGHTDGDPINKAKKLFPTNWELSSARAVNVVRRLVTKGVGRDRIYAAAFADTQPRASNATASGKALNRRVEIVILPKLPVKKKTVR